MAGDNPDDHRPSVSPTLHDVAPPPKKHKPFVGPSHQQMIKRQEREDTINALLEIEACTNDLRDEMEVEIEDIRMEVRTDCETMRQIRDACIERVPNYWLKVFLHHPSIMPLIDVLDEDCLSYLYRIDRQAIVGGYRIVLKFRPNPYFHNDALIKQVTRVHQPSYRRFGACSLINWKPHKSIVRDMEWLREQPGTSTAPIRRSFFDWFNDIGVDADYVLHRIRFQLEHDAQPYFYEGMAAEWLDDDRVVCRDDYIESFDDIDDILDMFDD